MLTLTEAHRFKMEANPHDIVLRDDEKKRKRRKRGSSTFSMDRKSKSKRMKKANILQKLPTQEGETVMKTPVPCLVSEGDLSPSRPGSNDHAVKKKRITKGSNTFSKDRKSLKRGKRMRKGKLLQDTVTPVLTTPADEGEPFSDTKPLVITTPADEGDHSSDTVPPVITTPAAEGDPSSDTNPPVITTPAAEGDPSSDTNPPVITTPADEGDHSSDTVPPVITTPAAEGDPSSDTNPPVITTPAAEGDPSSDTNPPVITTPAAEGDPSSDTNPPVITTPAAEGDPSSDTNPPVITTPADEGDHSSYTKPPVLTTPADGEDNSSDTVPSVITTPTDEGDPSSFSTDTDYSSIRESPMSPQSTQQPGIVHIMPVLSPSDNKPPKIDDQFSKLTMELQNILTSPYFIKVLEQEIQIHEFYEGKDSKLSVKQSVSVDTHFQARIFVHWKEVPETSMVWFGQPSAFNTAEKVTNLLSRINSLVVCMGNPDEEYHDLIPVEGNINDKATSSIRSYREGDFCAKLANFTYHSTIRSVKCQLLVKGNRCSHCGEDRRMLRKRKVRLEDQKNCKPINYLHTSMSHSNMSRDMLIEKIKQQQLKIKSLTEKADRIKQKANNDILQFGAKLDDLQNVEMHQLMLSCCDEAEQAFPESNSFQRLFWEQQKKFLKSGGNGMRWHPMIIRWCLHIRSKSSKAYDVMRNAGFVKLPSIRTLFDYSNPAIPSPESGKSDTSRLLLSEENSGSTHTEYTTTNNKKKKNDVPTVVKIEEC